MSPSPSQTTPDLLDDRYRIDDEIGHGGYCQVLAATDEVEGSAVAIKWLHARATDTDPRAADRLRQESQFLRAIDHPHVVRFVDAGHNDNGHYLVMERAPGLRLDHLIDDQGPLDSEVVQALMVQLLDALCAAHQGGILHRDLKPANLLIDGLSPPHLTLVDFGIAKADDLLDPDDPDGGITLVKTQAGNFVGTPQYAAPEMVVGDPAEPASDLFCAGLIAFEALTARSLLQGSTQRALINELIVPRPFDLSDLPEPWGQWLAPLLEKAPDRRPASAREALTSFYDIFPNAPSPPTVTDLPAISVPPDDVPDPDELYAPIGDTDDQNWSALELDEEVLNAQQQSNEPPTADFEAPTPTPATSSEPRELNEASEPSLTITQTLLIFSIIALLTFLAAGLLLF